MKTLEKIFESFFDLADGKVAFYLKDGTYYEGQVSERSSDSFNFLTGGPLLPREPVNIKFDSVDLKRLSFFDNAEKNWKDARWEPDTDKWEITNVSDVETKSIEENNPEPASIETDIKPKGIGIIKLTRRLIVLVCIIILAPLAVESIPEGKYYNGQMEDLVKNGNAQVIEAGKKVKIDNDTLNIQKVIKSGSDIYVRYSLSEEIGWPFPWSCIKLNDNIGHKIPWEGNESSGKIWGEEALVEYGPIDSDCQELTFTLDLYDRKMEVKVPLAKEGNK
ncbi:MAG: hypothetical protein Q8930_07220 [Bacillota bacterium]|nr:hypothetical protein [Bacillota bacterium]